MRRSTVAMILVGTAAACATSQKVAPPRAPATPAVPANAPSTRWVPIEVPPQGYESKLDHRALRLGPELHYRAVPTPRGEVRIDEAGARWLMARTGAKRAQALDPVEHVAIGWGDGVGLVSVGRDRRVRVAREPIDAWASVAALPKDVELESVRVHAGGLSARQAGRLAMSANLRDWSPVPFFGDRAPIDALIGRDGSGIGLFVPQAIATTRDGGKSWSPLSDAGVTAAFLLQAPDGKVLVGPGGERDPFLRSWDGKLGLERWTARGLELSSEASRPQPAIEGPSSWSIDLDAPMPQRHRSLVRSLLDGSAALDGDQVLALANTNQARKEEDPTRALIGTGLLGRGVSWKPIELPPESCTGIQRRRAALSYPNHAVTCDERLVVSVTGKSPLVLSLPWKAQGVAFQSPRRVLVAGGPPPTKDMESEVQVLALDLDAPTSLRPVPVTRAKHTGDLRWVTAALEGERDAPVWLVSQAYSRSSFAWRLGSSGFTHEGELEGGSRVVGLAPDGALVLVAGQVLIRHKDGKHTKSDLGFEVRGDAWMPSLRQGRALLLSKSFQLHETLDAGKTWRTVASPAFAARQWNDKHVSAIACSPGRCQLGDEIVREGWSTGSEAEPPASTKAVPEPPKAQTRSAASVVTCTVHGSFTPASLPGVVESIHPGVRGAVWSGFAFAESDSTQSWIVNGARDGSVSHHRLKLQQHGPSHFSGTLLGRFGSVNDGAGTAAEWQADAQGPVFEKRWKPREGWPRLQATGLVGPTGSAIVDPSEQELVWLTATGHEHVRRWPGVLTGRTSPSGSFVEANDVWYSLFRPADLAGDDSAAPWFSRLQSQGELGAKGPVWWRQVATLVAIGPDHSFKARTFVVETAEGPETGTSLVLQGGKPALASVEVVAGGGSELRVRPLDADLRPGKAVTLASTKPFELLGLRACEGDGEGSPLMLAARVPMTFSVAGEELHGHLVRRVMLGPSSACVRNTVLATVEDRADAASGRLGASPQGTLQSRVVLGGAGATPGVALTAGGVKGVTCKLAPVLD